MLRWATLVLLHTALQVAGQTTPNGVVSGTVVNAANGEPLAGALVVLRVSYASYGFRDRAGDRPSPGDMARAVTDESGNFTIRFDPALPATRLFVSHEGFRSEDNREIVTVPLLSAGARNVSVALVPQSVVQGQVVDSEGIPLKGVVVRAIRVEVQDGRRVLRHNYGAAVSGADGAYRLAPLAPGSYYLEASGAGADGRGYGPLYFPGMAEQAAAHALQARAGETLTADFELSPHPLYKIRGVLNNVPPMTHVVLRLLRGEEPLSNPTQVNGGNKSFEIESVPPGSYVVQAFIPETIPADFGEAAITVADRDPAPVQIALSSAVDVRGRIEVVGGRRPARFVYVNATPLTPFPPLRIPPLSRAMMLADGSFLLRNLLPGKYEISVRLLPGSYIESMTASSPGRGTDDVQQNGLVIGPGRPPELKIAIRRGGGEIEGRVEDAERGGAVPIVVARRNGTTRSVTLVSAEQGRFLASGLAPGEYDLYALPPSMPVEYRNPDVLDALRQFAGHAEVRDGLTGAVTLRLVPANIASHPLREPPAVN
jgi:hypothetical protein